MQPSLTKDLVAHLCAKLGHEEAVGPCIKTLVAEQWLERVADLKRVPRDRLEAWGLPLRLVHEMRQHLDDPEDEVWALIEDTVGPRLARISPAQALKSLRDDAERRRRPDVWAAKLVQRRWREVREERRVLEEARALAVVDVWRPSEAEGYERRRRRALQRLREPVRAWVARVRARQRLGGAATRSRPSDQASIVSSEDGAQGLAAALERRAGGQPRDCEVTRLVRQIGKRLGRSDSEVAPYVHSLVVQHWLEEVADLELVEDRHWEAWGIPAGLAVHLRSAAEREGERSFLASASEIYDAAGQQAVGILQWTSGLFFGLAASDTAGDSTRNSSLATRA